MCPYIEDGWVYSWYEEETDDEVASLSVPNGSMYDIVDEDTYYMHYYNEDESGWNYYDDLDAASFKNEEAYYDV